MGAIFRGLHMALQAEEKLASQINPDFTGWRKLVSQIRRDFSPGIIDSETTQASAPRTRLLRVAAATPAISPASFANGHNRTTPARTMGSPWDSHGITMGSRWDLRLSNPFRNGTLRKKSHKIGRAGHRRNYGDPLPSHKSHALLYLPTTHIESSTYGRNDSLSGAIIQLTTTTQGGRGVNGAP